MGSMRYSTPVVPKAASSAAMKGNKHKGKVKPLPITIQFCTKGVRHYCFRVPDVGWFVMVNLPEAVRGQGGPRTLYTVHSVFGVNTAEAVRKYIQTDIMRDTDKKVIARELQMRALNEDLNYHEKTEEYEQRQQTEAAADPSAPDFLKGKGKVRAEWGSHRDHS